MAFPTFWKTIKNEFFSLKSVFLILVISIFYYSFSVLIINYRLLTTSINLKLLLILITGSYSALGTLDTILLIITSVLVSANLLMLYKILLNLKKAGGKLSLTIGGTTALGVLVAGSCSCGFSLISILGLTSAVTLIPFGTLGLHLLTIFLLIFSLWYSANTYHKKVVCKIK